jgi:hypothetical protein
MTAALKAKEASPEDSRVSVALGMALIEAGREHEGLEELRAGTNKEGGFVVVRYALAGSKEGMLRSIPSVLSRHRHRQKNAFDPFHTVPFLPRSRRW